ncbi:MAG: 4Fe-4S dicluster domain-containing protein, partial [Synechococcales bacterium]|nr:4Fe-4S dicluster domain-containing protein [Synechococcales bacterium]
MTAMLPDSESQTRPLGNSDATSSALQVTDLKFFDGKNPPDPKLIDSCVHCGFCLSTCPSYRVLGKEMDSPRGRIYLMDGVNEQKIPFSAATVQHFDSCLGCLACVSTCPSGVQYDKLIEATRAQVARNHPRS